MATFDEIRITPKKKRSECSRCDKQAAGRIQVVAAQKVVGGKGAGAWKYIVTKQEMYCEEHLVTKYKELEKAL